MASELDDLVDAMALTVKRQGEYFDQQIKAAHESHREALEALLTQQRNKEAAHQHDIEVLLARIDALEKQAPVPGPQGPAGRDGADGGIGPQGPQGERGESVIGPQGLQGLQGIQGERGADGLVGKDGAVGPQGMAGLDGRDGLPGVPGATGPQGMTGERGLDGIHGKDGLNGKDGINGTVENIAVDTFDIETRTLHFKYKASGERLPDWSIKLPITLDRGVYKPGKSYEQGDSVSYAGSVWIAQSDTSARPGDSQAESRAWRLSVKKGADGKGVKGDVGPQGPRGEPGPQGPRVY